MTPPSMTRLRSWRTSGVTILASDTFEIPKIWARVGAGTLGYPWPGEEFVAVLDADDWWDTEKLESQLGNIRREPGEILCFTDKISVSSSGKRSMSCDPAWLEHLDRGLRLENEIVHSTVLISHAALEAVNGYDPGFPQAEDWDLWLRLTHRFGPSSFVHLGKPLIFY